MRGRVSPGEKWRVNYIARKQKGGGPGKLALASLTAHCSEGRCKLRLVSGNGTLESPGPLFIASVAAILSKHMNQ